MRTHLPLIYVNINIYSIWTESVFGLPFLRGWFSSRINLPCGDLMVYLLICVPCSVTFSYSTQAGFEETHMPLNTNIQISEYINYKIVSTL